MVIERTGEDAPPDARAAAAPNARITRAESIGPLLWEEWRTLAATASEPNPFAESWFAAPSLQHLAPSAPRLIEVRANDRLIGVMLVVVERNYGRLPIDHVENWHHHHHFLGAPLVRRGKEEDFWCAAIEALDGARWASGFLHIAGLVEDGPVHHGLAAAARRLGRPCAIVHREQRALLASELDAKAYYEQTVRKKKRKEIGRLRNRLVELGTLATRTFGESDDLASWCDSFLALERSGWKGEAGSALGCAPATEAFFREAVAGAHAAGRLQFLSLELDGRPIAMLVNFLTPPGSFSFKTAYDEALARFSPGVLLQLDNLAILERPDIAWMDSCAAAEHPMIDSLWGERRAIVRLTLPLRGARRRLAFAGARLLEEASAARRRLSERRSKEA